MDGEYNTFVRDVNAYRIFGGTLRGNIISKLILKNDVKCKDVNRINQAQDKL
jgi:hypothetical protein